MRVPYFIFLLKKKIRKIENIRACLETTFWKEYFFFFLKNIKLFFNLEMCLENL